MSLNFKLWLNELITTPTQFKSPDPRLNAVYGFAQNAVQQVMKANANNPVLKNAMDSQSNMAAQAATQGVLDAIKNGRIKIDDILKSKTGQKPNPIQNQPNKMMPQTQNQPQSPQSMIPKFNS